MASNPELAALPESLSLRFASDLVSETWLELLEDSTGDWKCGPISKLPVGRPPSGICSPSDVGTGTVNAEVLTDSPSNLLRGGGGQGPELVVSGDEDSSSDLCGCGLNPCPVDWFRPDMVTTKELRLITCRTGLSELNFDKY